MLHQPLLLWLEKKYTHILICQKEREGNTFKTPKIVEEIKFSYLSFGKQTSLFLLKTYNDTNIFQDQKRHLLIFQIRKKMQMKYLANEYKWNVVQCRRKDKRPNVILRFFATTKQHFGAKITWRMTKQFLASTNLEFQCNFLKNISHITRACLLLYH